MSIIPRRQVVRPAARLARTSLPPKQRQRLRQQLEAEATAFARWFRRLQRASRALEKHHTRQQRLERRLRLLENAHVASD